MRLVISVGQMDVHAGEPETNLACVREWTAEAARRGSDLVVFPELWDTGFALDRAFDLGTPLGEGRFAEVAALAREHGIHIAGSMLEVAEADGERRAYNTAVWYTPEGEIAGVYRKLHLFPLMDEDRFLTPGDAPCALDAPWGQTGLATCYDLRFPELFRGYALGGAVMALIPAQWAQARIDVWRTLLRARAIENQMVVVGCNRTGADGDERFGGRSAVLDARGDVIVEAGESAVLLTAEVDFAHVAEVRRHIPVFENRRPDVYG